MVGSSDIFEKNYQEYCAQLAKIDFGSIRDGLGLITDGDRMFIPFFNRRYWVSNNGIVDTSGNRPDYMVCVILAKYILLCPDQPNDDKEWVSFKDFKRVSHFTNVNYFSSDTQRAIEKHFSGKLNELKNACQELEGFHHAMEISYDLSIQFNALPRISLLLLFNDGDEEFPATGNILFDSSIEKRLSAEDIAVMCQQIVFKIIKIRNKMGVGARLERNRS